MDESKLTEAINKSDIEYSLLKMNILLAQKGTSSLLKDLFLNSPIICCLVNSSTGHFDLVNMKFMEILKWDLEESTSKPMFDFIYPPDKDITLKTFSIYHADIVGHETRMYVFMEGYFYNRYMTKNGSYRWLKWGVSKPMVTYGKNNEYSIAMAVPVDGIPLKWVNHIKELHGIDVKYVNSDILKSTQ